MVIASSPPKYCRLFAQKKAHQGGEARAPQDPPSYAPELSDNLAAADGVVYLSDTRCSSLRTS